MVKDMNADEAWLPIGRDQVLNAGINERSLRTSPDVQWDHEWQAYWVKVPSKMWTWINLAGIDSPGILLHPKNS